MHTVYPCIMSLSVYVPLHCWFVWEHPRRRLLLLVEGLIEVISVEVFECGYSSILSYIWLTLWKLAHIRKNGTISLYAATSICAYWSEWQFVRMCHINVVLKQIRCISVTTVKSLKLIRLSPALSYMLHGLKLIHVYTLFHFLSGTCFIINRSLLWNK